MDKKTDKEKKRKNYRKPELTKHKPLREVTMAQTWPLLCTEVIEASAETC